jgi:predicted MFS family arabinose efflux permease
VYFSLDAVGTLCSRVFTGTLLDRYGPKPLLMGSYAALSVALVMLGMAAGPIAYGCSALLLGAGFGVMIPTVQTMCMNLVEAQRRGAANGTLYSAFDIGIGGGAVLLGAIAEAAGYRAMFIAQGLALVIPAALFLFFILPAYKRSITAPPVDIPAIP